MYIDKEEYVNRVKLSKEDEEVEYFMNYYKITALFGEIFIENDYIKNKLNTRLLNTLFRIIKEFDEMQNQMLNEGYVIDSFYFDSGIDFAYLCIENLRTVDTSEKIRYIEYSISLLIDSLNESYDNITNMSDNFIEEHNKTYINLFKSRPIIKGNKDFKYI